MALTERRAKELGYYLSEGSYYGTQDDRSGRWYILKAGESVDKRGKGFATKENALLSLEESLSLRGDL